MAKETLGEFEHHVLLATRRLGPGAYSAAIVEELEEVTGRDVAPAAVYIALRRLEDGGLARSDLRAPPEGGRDRRYFEPTPAGLTLMGESRRRFEALWQGLPAGGGER
ncbi:MAG: PadR family transcriptional regulator [Gemmatimonadales bacterium]|jgi:DNA-binding PadR family transcriptional regulator|nr:MAG: PadR family transcriptional regulator [Gemmatimonadales bacterium]